MYGQPKSSEKFTTYYRNGCLDFSYLNLKNHIICEEGNGRPLEITKFDAQVAESIMKIVLNHPNLKDYDYKYHLLMFEKINSRTEFGFHAFQFCLTSTDKYANMYYFLIQVDYLDSSNWKLDSLFNLPLNQVGMPLDLPSKFDGLYEFFASFEIQTYNDLPFTAQIFYPKDNLSEDDAILVTKIVLLRRFDTIIEIYPPVEPIKKFK